MKNVILQCGQRSLDLSKAQVMGILNVTPDSFSDGGRFTSLNSALRQARQMTLDGAAIIDIGGESTRPGADPVSEQQELDRVIPVIEAIRRELDVLISVDTSTAAVIREATLAGAHLVNDVRALQREGALQAAADSGLPVCLMHMQGNPQTMQDNPEYRDVVQDVKQFLEQRVEVCEKAGIIRERILLDPGFGFGKTTEHNYQLLNRMEQLHDLELPLLIGLSRKRMIGAATGGEIAEQRVCGSVAGAVISVMKGAKILRVHDVKETFEALAVANATLSESV
ncbi:dihydropteroate synthase [Bacterioplanoides sp.]|uniref:dihydropteroate synthase n=1 Tax=Bacterioplanoides sp. TaxID=2066072 RepID=UPI003B5CBA59